MIDFDYRILLGRCAFMFVLIASRCVISEIKIAVYHYINNIHTRRNTPMTDTTTITLAEYLTDSEIWPFSRERFELLRECGELTLMEAYAEAEDYIAENADSLTDETLGLLITEAGNRPSTIDKLADYLSSPGMAAKLAEKKYGVGTQVFELLRTISQANVTFADKAYARFMGNRKDKIIALNTEAEKLLEQAVKLGSNKLSLPVKTDTKHTKLELVKATFDRDTANIRRFNDALKGCLSDTDYRTLKINERWLAPKLAIQQLKVVSTIGELLTETARVVGAICGIQSGSVKVPDVVKAIDSISAKIAGMKADSTITFVNADTLRRTYKSLKSADDKLNEDIKNFLKDAKPASTTIKKAATDNGDSKAAYGAIFTALTSLVTELRWATKSTITCGKGVMDQIDAAIEFQKQVLAEVREKIK
jgi:hypothetical protein